MGRTLTIKTPRVFLPLLKPARYKGAYGGRGSAKSHTFAEMLVERCLMQPTRAVCVREVQESIAQSVKQLLVDKINGFGLSSAFVVQDKRILTPHGGEITFRGMQNHTAEAVKSLEGGDIAWVEEAQSLSQGSLDILRPTLRKEGSELWFTWNPKKPTDPIDALLRNGEPPPGTVLVKANWPDNPWFPDVLRAEMEWDRRRDPEKYRHIWLGEYQRRSEARVFKNWREEEFKTPEGVPFLFGGDWGFSVDPSVCIRSWPKSRVLFVDWEAHEVGCEIEDTPALFDRIGCPACLGGPRNPSCKAPGHGMARRWVITADSARPETISHMQRHGYPRVEPARKGPGSVEEGVEFLKGYDIVVHPRCPHTIDELINYSFKTDPKTGLVLPILEDKKNHVIDSLRYAVEPLRRRGVQARDAAWG